MQVFMYTVDLPENVWDERVVKDVEEKKHCLLLWTEKELNSYYSGEFGWKKLGLTGVCSIQYVNRRTARLIVRGANREMTDNMVKSFSWHLDQKKFHKRRYAPRKSGVIKKVTPEPSSTSDGRAVM
jgi:hypothetical protein